MSFPVIFESVLIFSLFGTVSPESHRLSPTANEIISRFGNQSNEMATKTSQSSDGDTNIYRPMAGITSLDPGHKARYSLSDFVTHSFPCVVEKSLEGVIVNCSHRNLTLVPTNFPKNATELFLNNNNIACVPSGAFRDLVGLERLDFSHNNLRRLESGAFEGLHHLKFLLLNENPLYPSHNIFPDDVFAPLSSLKHLNLKSSLFSDDPRFGYPDVALSRLPSLDTLAINGLSNRTFGEGVRKMTSLQSLDFSHTASFTSISKFTFANFRNISVRTLILSYCNLIFIHREAFIYLSHIDTIDYSHNKNLGLSGVGVSTYGLRNSTIRKIVMRRVHSTEFITILTSDDLQHLQHTHLEELYADNNSIGLMYPGTKPIVSLPTSLKAISVSWNTIQTDTRQILALARFHNLEFLDISDQEAYATGPDGVNKGLRSFVRYNRSFKRHFHQSQKSRTDFTYNDYSIQSGLSYVLQVHIPPRLRILNGSRIYKIRGRIPPLQFINSSLEHVDFSVNEIYKWQGPIKGAETARYLDLSSNNCRSISETFFAYLIGLETLLIGKNKFGQRLSDNTFYNLTSLKKLQMNDIQMETVGLNLFSRLTNLTHLELSQNYISVWNANISGLVNLQILNLTNNKLRALPASLCHDLDIIRRFSDVEVDIEGNPFECSCDTAYFLQWLTVTNVRIKQLNNTNCTLTNGTVLSLANRNILTELQRNCRSYSLLIGGLCACLVVFSLIVSVKIIHRNRWQIKYLCYIANNRRKRTGYEKLDSIEENPFGYDAFISYEDNDRTFLREEILPRLETEAGLKLCIDKRDFVPGLYVTDNILHAIQSSRKTVVMLSREFLRSTWCLYEFNMARMEGIYQSREVLIVVLTEEIPVGEMPADVREIVRQQTYIEMTGNAYGQSLFWDRLVTAIKSE